MGTTARKAKLCEALEEVLECLEGGCDVIEVGEREEVLELVDVVREFAKRYLLAKWSKP